MGESVSSPPRLGESLRIWEVDRLLALAEDLPVEVISVSSLPGADEVGWIGRPEHFGRLTIRDVVEHIRRVQGADLARPLILSCEGWLMDGFHRLARALLDGVNELPVRQFRADPEPDRIRPLLDWLALTLGGQDDGVSANSPDPHGRAERSSESCA
jgi:hypothetical protein